MANKPISNPLPADLPTNWTRGQTIAPAGTDVGLASQYGYNYLMQAVNAAQNGVNTINNAFPGLATTDQINNINNNFSNYYTKLQTIAEDTKTEYGLQSGAIPDDVFSILANAVLYKNGQIIGVNGSPINGISKIEAGNYVGTGTSGSSSPNSITFQFPPKIVFIQNSDANETPVVFINPSKRFFLFFQDTGGRATSTSGLITWSGNTVSWNNIISGGADSQFNTLGDTYNYIAFG